MEALNMNKELFEKYIKEEKKTVLVEFWAPWCVYCRRIAPAMKKVIAENEEKLIIAQINIDEEGALGEEEQIEVVPTFVMYKEGKAVDSIVAPDSKAKIEEFIEKNL